MDITSYLLGKNSAGGGGGGGSDLDWTALGYSSQPQYVTDVYNGVQSDYDYSKEIMDDWVFSEDLTNKFSNDNKLKFMPLVDISEATNMYRCFKSCSSLRTIPQLDTSKVTNMYQCFMSCPELTDVPILNLSSISGSSSFSSTFANDYKLTNTSVNNILKSLAGATSYTGTKTLAQLGFSNTYYPASTIQALPNYQAFIDAGWTIGY